VRRCRSLMRPPALRRRVPSPEEDGALYCSYRWESIEAHMAWRETDGLRAVGRELTHRFTSSDQWHPLPQPSLANSACRPDSARSTSATSPRVAFSTTPSYRDRARSAYPGRTTQLFERGSHTSSSRAVLSAFTLAIWARCCSSSIGKTRPWWRHSFETIHATTTSPAIDLAREFVGRRFDIV